MGLEQLRSDDSLRRLSLARHRKQVVNHRYGGDNDVLWLALLNAPLLESKEILQPHQVSDRLDKLLRYSRIAYWSGGFDGAYHHMLMDAISELIPKDMLVLLGIEPNSYIEEKGRLAVLYQEDRLRTMARLFKKNGKLAGAIFLPSRDKNIRLAQHYDTLIKSMGLYRRPGIYHLFTDGDPAADAKRARMLDPQPWCELPKIGHGNSMSTTKILQEV